MPVWFPVRSVLLAALTLLPLVLVISLLHRSRMQPRPSLEQVCALAQAERFEEAQAQGDAYLRSYPEDAKALLVTAEVSLAGSRPAPRRALELLGRIQPESRTQAAWVLVDQGRAHYLLSRYDRAEACWKEAFEKDHAVLQAGRRLLDLFRLQGRLSEARTLGLRQVEREPDPLDRLRVLFLLARLDVDPPDPWAVVNQFAPAVRSRSADLPTSLAYGLALTWVSRSQEGLPILHEAVTAQPENPAAWDALLTGLGIANRSAELKDAYAQLPQSMASDPRFAKHRGRVEQDEERWALAACSFRRAWEYEPDNTIGYRLQRALFFAGQTDQAERAGRMVLDYRNAFKAVRGLVERASEAVEAGERPAAGLCEQMASLRERMRHGDEARAWHDWCSRNGNPR
jgi:tetratricopeptide (TPR) repeat protein